MVGPSPILVHFSQQQIFIQMASAISYHMLHTHFLTHRKITNSPNSKNSLKRKPKFASFRFRTKALPKPKDKNSSIPPFLRLSDGFKVDELGREILSIALPATLALAADPIISLVDTAFVGHLGSVELAAVGVSVSVFNLVSKLFNVPLLNITTSFVAEEDALISMQKESSIQGGEDKHENKKALPSVSTSLILAAGLGLAEAVALSLGSGFLMNIMGFTNARTS